MVQITNTAGISLPLAVWLLHDTYDYQKSDKPYISATTMMKPVRQTVLAQRINHELVSTDLQDFIAKTLGHSIHDSIEKAWKHGRSNALRLLGYPADVVDRVRVNPSDAELDADPGIIPVFIEQRLYCEFDGYVIGGKFDMVTEGIVNDFKSTSAYSWVFGGKDNDYRLQGSIYRWLDSKQARPAYPQQRVETRDIPLMSLVETEAWIINRIAAIKRALPAKEHLLPECTDEELWMSEPKYKYYSNPENTSGRSTKNFDTLAAANKHLSEAGKGVVVTVPGEPKRCEYCEVFDLCSQKDKWFKS
jgi:PD-(D/E)XK nuclease superfamily